MKANQQKQVWYLMLLVIAFLSLDFWLPDFSILGFQFKKINLMADIQNLDQAPVAKDSSVAHKDSAIVIVLPSKASKGFIEEFGKNNLNNFFKSLSHSKTQPVRIAFFGDSFIEGDILCGPFRDTLQRLFGGSGVGYMPITSEVTKFRTSIQHEFTQWNTFSIVGQRKERAPLGLPGYCFIPADGNEVIYTTVGKNFVSTKVFYESDGYSKVRFSFDESQSETTDLEPAEKLHQYTFPGSGFHSVKISFPFIDNLRL